MLKRERNVVQGVQEAVLAERVHLEREAQAVFVGDELILKVHGEFVTRMGGRALEEVFDDLFAEPDREHAIFERIVEENVGKTRRDEDFEPVIRQPPRSVFAAGTRAEITAREQDRSSAVLRFVQLEVRIFGAVFQKAPVEEYELPEAGALDPFEELLRHDLVCIDVGTVHRDHESGMGGEFFHLETS